MEDGAEIGGRQQDALTAFCLGDEAAFEELFRLHQRAVYHWILRIVRHPGAAEELTAESFLRIWQARARFDPRKGFAPWARRIATRAALDWLRRKRPECALAFEAPAPIRGDPAVATEERLAVLGAFGRLSPALRVAATLAVLEELPQREVAEALGITQAAVKLRVYRALRQVRNELKRRGITP